MTAFRRPWVQALGAFVLYLGGSIMIWGLPVLGHLGSRYIPLIRGDPDFYRWALAWTPWAIGDGRSPLFSSLIYAPDGAGLAWTAITPGAAVLVWPVTTVFGTLVSLNVLLLLAPALAGWAAYLMCSRVTRAFWPSFVGGTLFGFCTYMGGHIQVGHLNLVLTFPIPLAVYLVIRRIEGSLGSLPFVALLSVTLLTLFLFSTELFATTALFGGVALVAAVIAAGSERRRVLTTSLQVGAAFAIVAAVVSVPYLVPALRDAPSEAIRPAERAAADLAGWIVPRADTAIGGQAFAGFTEDFSARVHEDGSYVGVALVAMMVGFAVTERRRTGTWALVAFVGVIVVLSLGTLLHVGGRVVGAMPTAWLWDLPLIQNATPQRYPAYAALATCVVAAIWIARASRSWVRWALAVVGLVMLLPSVPESSLHPEDRVPAFFDAGAFRDVLHDNENVFVIPGHNGEEMLWQSESGFAFAMPEGYIGPLPEKFPKKQKLFRGHSAEDVRAFVPSSGQLRSWIDERGVTAVILGDLARLRLEPILVKAGFRPAFEGNGVSVWRATDK